jgi:hypothetical protein
LRACLRRGSAERNRNGTQPDCRADRAACKDPIQARFDAAVAACTAAKQAAIDACAGDAACIVQAKVVAFQCRDDARKAAKPGLAACRDAFRACVDALYGDPACVVITP